MQVAVCILIAVVLSLFAIKYDRELEYKQTCEQRIEQKKKEEKEFCKALGERRKLLEDFIFEHNLPWTLHWLSYSTEIPGMLHCYSDKLFTNPENMLIWMMVGETGGVHSVCLFGFLCDRVVEFYFIRGKPSQTNEDCIIRNEYHKRSLSEDD